MGSCVPINPSATINDGLNPLIQFGLKRLIILPFARSFIQSVSYRTKHRGERRLAQPAGIKVIFDKMNLNLLRGFIVANETVVIEIALLSSPCLMRQRAIT